jgi:hypothetical protein
MTLLATVNASGASSVTFNSTYITTTYNKYVVEFDGVYTNDGGTIYLTLSTNNGSTYLSSNYSQSGCIGTGGGGYTCATVGSKAQIDLGNGCDVTSSTSTLVSAGTVKLSNLAQAVQAMITSDTFFGGTACANNQQRMDTGGFNSTTTAINNIKFTDGLGGTITGNFHLYGLSGT